ncbi:MAG: hypothetical protein K2M17_01550 [Bacilli bacterium]|nr:hypothetical protein [Bacilli bacterium]
MKIETGKNYSILSNSIDHKLLTEFSEYTVLDDTNTFDTITETIEKSLNKIIVFNDCLRLLRKIQKEKIVDLLRIRNMNFINITSNIEETLYSDYLYVLDADKVIIEGKTTEVLKEEKILKRLGFGLPFCIDISTQLGYYGILNKVYYDIEGLVNDLWN